MIPWRRTPSFSSWPVTERRCPFSIARYSDLQRSVESPCRLSLWSEESDRRGPFQDKHTGKMTGCYFRLEMTERKNGWTCAVWVKRSSAIPISFPELRSPWPAVGKRELWEQPFQACAIAWNRCKLRLRSEPDNQNSVISHCYFKIDAPRALVFRPLAPNDRCLSNAFRRCFRLSGVL